MDIRNSKERDCFLEAKSSPIDDMVQAPRVIQPPSS